MINHTKNGTRAVHVIIHEPHVLQCLKITRCIGFMKALILKHSPFTLQGRKMVRHTLKTLKCVWPFYDIAK